MVLAANSGVVPKAARVRGELSSTDDDQFGEAFVRRAHLIISGLPADEAVVELLSPLASAGEAAQVDVCHVLVNSNAFLFID